VETVELPPARQNEEPGEGENDEVPNQIPPSEQGTIHLERV
jgi:hypothetical protein